MTEARPIVVRAVDTVLPTDHGRFTCIGFEGSSGAEHVVLLPEPRDRAGTDGRRDHQAPLVRLHSECLTGEVLGSRRCECGPQLAEAMRLIGSAGTGAIVYLRGHEGRGIGLLEKLKAYRLQDLGFDTVDANLELGHPADGRDYAEAAAMLHAVGLTTVRLLTNNDAKRVGVQRHGITVVETVPLVVAATETSRRYLDVKRDRLGHRLPYR